MGAAQPRPPTGSALLDDPARLRTVLLKLARRLRAIDAGSGFTPVELSVLGCVVRRGPLRASDLAGMEGVNPTMLSRLLSRLEATGTVRRRTAPADRRVTLVEPTAAGRRLHHRLAAERAGALGALLRRLPDSEREAIAAALPALEALAELLRAGSW